MGGGKEKSSANKQLEGASEYEVGARNRFDERNQSDLKASQARTDDVYSSLRASYGDLAAGKKTDPAAASSGGGGGGAATPGPIGPAAYDWTKDPRFTDVDKSYKNLMDTGGVEMDKLRQNDPTYNSMRDTGGYSPEALGSLRGQLGKVSGIGDKLTAGMSPEAQNRMRGGGTWDEIARTGGLTQDDIDKIQASGTFDEFRRTGGLSDQDQANIRSRASSGIPGQYDRMRDEVNRQTAVTGTTGPGKAILMGRFGRDQAKATADSKLNTEVDLRNQINAGRQWGATAQSGAQSNIAGMRTGNRLAGAAGMAQSEGALQDQNIRSLTAGADVLGQAYQGDKSLYDTVNANKMGAVAAQDATERANQELRQSGMKFGSQGTQSRAEGDRGYERGVLESDRQFDLSNRSLAASSGAASAAGDRWQQEFDFRKQQAGLEGLGSLYSSNPSEYFGNKNFDIANCQQGTSGVAGPAASRLQGNQGTNWGGMIGGVGSAFGSFLPLGGGGPKSNQGDNGYSSISGDFNPNSYGDSYYAGSGNYFGGTGTGGFGPGIGTPRQPGTPVDPTANYT